eukprot:TRINITY_DN16904_c0_g1_i1.p2 TRINITY_DN16904_c0_g1~~TRINITY_DN16904_c0_g1_i1.p2  ORF type:complete len:262 (+),score=101.68 TRINITY_DN16904_c0_g1_i1:77-862(+)
MAAVAIQPAVEFPASDDCPIEPPPGLSPVASTFRAPPGLAPPPGLSLVRPAKSEDDDRSEHSTEADGSGSDSYEEYSPDASAAFHSKMNPNAQEFSKMNPNAKEFIKMNPNAQEFVPPTANKSKQTLNLTHAILVPEDETEGEEAYYKKESSKYPGRFYWVHKKTGATTWKAPGGGKAAAKKEKAEQPQRMSREQLSEALSKEITKTLSALSTKGSGSFDDTDGCSTDAGVEQSGESDLDSDFSRSSCSKSILPKLGKLVM